MSVDTTRFGAALPVVEGTNPDTISRTEQPPASRIPHRKPEVAQEARGTLVPPLRVRTNDQLRVADRPVLGRGRRQHVHELVAVVEPAVEHTDQGLDDDRLRFIHLLGRQCKRLVAEPGGAVHPRATTIRTPVVDRAEHPPEGGFVQLAVAQVEYHEDRAHRILS